MKYREHELKYEAYITREAFVRFMLTVDPECDILTAYGTDYFYTQGPDDVTFARFRDDRSRRGVPELTVKVQDLGKVSDRVEANVPLSRAATAKDAEMLLTNLGYEFRFQLDKISTIIHIPGAIVSHYTVNGEDDYIEIELAEGLAKDAMDAQAMLLHYEEILAPLMIGPENRVRKSLYAIYKEVNDAKGA